VTANVITSVMNAVWLTTAPIGTRNITAWLTCGCYSGCLCGGKCVAERWCSDDLK